METFVEVTRLCKSYPSGRQILHVLSGLDLEVRRGEMLAVSGASGSGKSTFLHLVGAMDTPDSGEITVGGRAVTGMSNEERARFRNASIGFVFQFHHLLPEFTALENTMMPLLLRRIPRATALPRAKRLLDEVGLLERGHHRPGELSGGEQQRVAIARALIGKPELLLADEPTGNLDDHTSASIHSLLVEIHRRNELTSIMVTHDWTLADLCQRHLKLEGGRLKEAFSTQRSG